MHPQHPDVGGLHIYQDADIVILCNIISTIWAVIRHQAGKQVSRLNWFCTIAYEVDTKEWLFKIWSWNMIIFKNFINVSKFHCTYVYQDIDIK